MDGIREKRFTQRAQRKKKVLKHGLEYFRFKWSQRF
jgi:hypothetical protein